MIAYKSSLFGFGLIFRVHGSALWKACIPAFLSTCILLVYVYSTGFDIDETNWKNTGYFVHPYVITAYITFFSFLLTFRLNYAYQRYWEGATAVYQMLSKWLDVATYCAAYHHQSQSYDKYRPPSFGQNQHLKNMTRERERITIMTEETILEGIHMQEEQEKNLKQQQSQSQSQQKWWKKLWPNRSTTITTTASKGVPSTSNNKSNSNNKTPSSGRSGGSSSHNRRLKKCISGQNPSRIPAPNEFQEQFNLSALIAAGTNTAAAATRNTAATTTESTRPTGRRGRRNTRPPDFMSESGRRYNLRGPELMMDASLMDASTATANASHLHLQNLNWHIHRPNSHDSNDNNNNNNNNSSSSNNTTTISGIPSSLFDDIPTLMKSSEPVQIPYPSLFLQEITHLVSLLAGVALSTLRNDFEDAPSPLRQYFPGEPRPPVNPDELSSFQRKEWKSDSLALSAIYYVLGLTRSRKHRTLYNAARPFQILGGISDLEIEMLQKSHGPYAKVALCSTYVQEFVAREYLSGSTGKIPGPLISRITHVLSDGMLGYNQARKLAYNPFPFPHAQMTIFFSSAVLFIFPLLYYSFVNNIYFACLMNFITVLCFLGIHEVARELENPYHNQPNDLPLTTFQAEFNEALITLYSGFHPDSWWEVVDDPLNKKKKKNNNKNSLDGTRTTHKDNHNHNHNHNMGVSDKTAKATNTTQEKESVHPLKR